MKKTLFGFLPAALVAAAVAIPAIGASANDEPAPARQAASAIADDHGAVYPDNGALAFHFVIKVNKSSN